MPYADKNKQLTYMRQWRKRNRARSTQQPITSICLQRYIRTTSNLRRKGNVHAVSDHDRHGQAVI